MKSIIEKINIFSISSICFVIILTSNVYGQKAKLINDIAVKAFEKENLVNENSVVKLYGIRTNGPDTNNGRWACAKVTSIILQKTGVIKEISLSVCDVESALNGWKQIEHEKDLKPGDIIVWISRFKGRKGRKCTGSGNCHVGVVTDKGYFHNSPLSRKPVFDGISLWAFTFKVGYRPPD